MFHEKDGGHPQLGASANGLDAGGGSNPPEHSLSLGKLRAQ